MNNNYQYYNNRLTIIIPYLNEGEEVFNTINSIKDHIGEAANIILINDASTDGYDYLPLSRLQHITYIRNKTRKGVAASRDLGISLCKTPYFLLLDAHMRFYDSAWLPMIIDELEQNDRVLLCNQLKFLMKEDGIVQEKKLVTTYGAYISLEEGNILAPQWIVTEENPNNPYCEDIPCVLGAGYAASKRYWTYLKGLEGLRCYGSDETYISIKVWLEGGKCKLMKKVIIGHLFKEAFGYTTNYTEVLYNRLLIASLLFPSEWKYQIYKNLKKENPYYWCQAFSLLNKKKKWLHSRQNYYKQIFTRDIRFIIEKNLQKSPVKNNDAFIKKIVSNIIKKFDEGKYELGHDWICHTLLICSYSQYTPELEVRQYADKLIDKLYQEFEKITVPNFYQNALCIGWGIEYLIQHCHIPGDSDNILEDIDLYIRKINISVLDSSLFYGQRGLLCYVTSRLKYWQKYHKPVLFSKRFLSKLKPIAQSIILDTNNLECFSVAMHFIDYLNNTSFTPHSLQISDIFIINETEKNSTSINDEISKENSCWALNYLEKTNQV